MNAAESIFLVCVLAAIWAYWCFGAYRAAEGKRRVLIPSAFLAAGITTAVAFFSDVLYRSLQVDVYPGWIFPMWIFLIVFPPLSWVVVRLMQRHR